MNNLEEKFYKKINGALNRTLCEKFNINEQQVARLRHRDLSVKISVKLMLDFIEQYLLDE